MSAQKLIGKKRDILGKKVKALRREGFIPANIFGKKVKSTAIQVLTKEFETIYKESGTTGLIELLVEKGEPRPVLVQHVQLHPVTGFPLHIDFRQVDLKEKVTATVPIEQKGESKAELDKKGLLLWVMDEVEVEALPTDLPEHIEVDVTKLAEIGEEIKVKDLQVDRSKVTILSEDEEIVCKVEELLTGEMKKQIEEEEKQAVAAAAESAATTEPPAAPEEGQAPEAEKAEEKPKETKKEE
ncbi:MAG TPA: 50S ribosomal protein L25 [Patescibacteria group bacterium]|nr:50S ribosomal protein L25 [Patescibacteria group bacterium]